MCLAIVAFHAHPSYAVLVAANRDEFHARPATPAGWWRDGPYAGTLAGRDLEAGGTWLGVTRAGRWAFVTNVREPGRHDPSAPSRGSLVPRVLHDDRDIAIALEATIEDGSRHNGFNLLAGDTAHAAWGSNRNGGAHVLVPGIYGLSNAQLDTPWPKLARTKAGVAAWIAAGGDDVNGLFALLGDRTMADDDALPATGVSREWERQLSAPFIVGDRYGTRCSTVLTITRDGAARFVERSFGPDGEPVDEVLHSFDLENLAVPATAISAAHAP